MSTSNRTIKWIENLADQELLIRAGEKVSIDILSTKDEVLAVETSAFVADLNFHFDYLVRLFNSRVSVVPLQLRIVQNENLDSFQVLRNDMRLVVSRRPGVVQFSCDRLVPNNKASVMFTGMLEAKFGTFHDVEWFFLGSKVSAEQVARHYLTEFIQISRGISEV